MRGLQGVAGACGLIALLWAASAGADTVQMASVTPYAEDADISAKVRTECVKLPTQLPAYTREFGAASSQEITLVDQVSADMPGRVLIVEIADAVSMGNAFIGHQKYSKVKGKLYQDGELIGSFSGRRNSMGGFGAGYKGSCSVLGRTIKALGKDIAVWLKNPSEGSSIGD